MCFGFVKPTGVFLVIFSTRKGVHHQVDKVINCYPNYSDFQEKNIIQTIKLLYRLTNGIRQIFDKSVIQVEYL